jgi:hypothetical protein
MQILKRRSLEGELVARVAMHGEYRLCVTRPDGTLAQDTGWFDNAILNAGMDRVGQGPQIGGAAIGQGTAVPAFTQTALQSLSAWTTTAVSNTQGAQGASPYFKTHTLQYRFAAGVLNGDYTEVGIGWGSTTLFSRALILDSLGAPTVIRVNAGEQLDLYYRLRYYYVETDVAGSFTLNGNAGGSYDYTSRPGQITSSLYPGTGMSSGAHPANANGFEYPYAWGPTATLGPITGSMSGAGAGYASLRTVDAYVTGSNQATGRATWEPAFGNIAGGIRGVDAYCSLGTWQYQFNTPIPKTATRTLVLNMRLAWARRG